MRKMVPSYYDQFRCTASGCRHNCCIGWEIDIDEKTEKRYLNYSCDDAEFLRKLKGSIAWPDRRDRRNGVPASFILSEKERCPFLTDENLCEIYQKMGKEALCQICTDHPRFRNFYKKHVEEGLGLCCEEAARIILSAPEAPVYYYTDDTPAVPEYQKCIDPSVIRRLSSRELSTRDWAEVLLSLERLDESWTELLLDLESCAECPVVPEFLEEEWVQRFERLKEYLLYRHFMEMGRDFVETVWNLLIRICEAEAVKKGSFSFEDMVEVARLYSGEIEYSDENTDAIMNELE